MGTDCRLVPAGEPTMNIELSLSSPESEWLRVGPHEFGHALAFPHEHSLPGIIKLLNPNKVVAWARRELGWPQDMAIQQILTPPPEGSYRMSATADQRGAMCYMLPRTITWNGQPIPGGTDIDEMDRAFALTVYPKAQQPPPPPAGKVRVTVEVDLATGESVIVR
jgi:hypothetical protein